MSAQPPIPAVIVNAGDTLSHIAERECGRASAWPALAAFNRLPNPHFIVPGQIIMLPRERSA